ncbi:S41 family peptidase [Chitinophaga vietnamensis]|uniref:S41 family peptidase n=1 Tax=Chitinophaga vietnamensis TaxID=2593957 RepID=UPI001177687E|nr:S41 family peptidase [Chitinophaga vietnamensis]
MKRLRSYALLVSTLLWSTYACAQWDVRVKKVSRETAIDLTHFLKWPSGKGFTFFGPAFDLHEQVETTGYYPERSSFPGAMDDTICKASLPNCIHLDKRNSFLYINCYTDNISEYTIGFEDERGQVYARSVKVTWDQYQQPLEIPLMQQGADSVAVSRLFVSIKKKQAHDPWSFVVGELRLYTHRVQDEPAKGCFFYQLTGDAANAAPSYTIAEIGNCYPLSAFTIFRDTYAQAFAFQPAFPLSGEHLEDSVIALLQLIIHKYPYYKEHHLDKKRIVSFLDTLGKSGVSFDRKLSVIDSLASSFSDGHFYLEKKSPALNSGPVYVKRINGRLEVIAVFDQALQGKVKPGDELLSVDGVPANSYMKTISMRYYGGEQERENMAVSRLLYKAQGDSTTIEVMDEGQRKMVSYYYNKAIAIPDNFKPVHRKISWKDDACYYRLNRWDAGDWLYFYNHRERISKAGAIIFDLRGNSGGLEVEAFKMLSCFLKQPILISRSSYAYSDSCEVEGPNVVVPNQFLNLSDKKVLILVDNNTACASEIFTSTLRNYARATVIGNEKTAGSYASGDIFYLPLNITMHVNILNKFSLNNKMGGSIEMRGINPDVQVPLESYRDLYPYDDKILSVAYSLLSKERQATVHR